MRTMVEWAVRNTPGMNVVMLALLVIGGACLAAMHREEFPEFELETILVSVPYPGASPEEVEEGVCLRIEEAVRPIDGIKKQTTVAQEGAANVVLELESNIRDVQKVLNEVRSEIDRIPSFPESAEDPEVKQITLRRTAIRVAVIGPESDDPEAELKLRSVAEDIRSELLLLDSVTQANLIGVRDYQIDVELSEETLRQHGLTLQDVARILRRENLELPGGLLKAESEHVLLRGKNKRLTGREIERIPLITRRDGVVLTVGDLGTVTDQFADTVAISRVNHQPGLVISIDKTAAEDLLTIVREVRAFLGEREMPAGYKLAMWQDKSIAVEDRMELLSRNGLQGLLLVFLMLAVFLEMRLAYWVAMGIPISILGACAILLYLDQTLNMLSMFAFLMALGIVVDDAIVIGENIYAHRQQGKPFTQAAIDGTVEVFPSVLGSVSTSIIAFIPLLFVSGIMGKFIAVLPVTIIAMLAISLLESTLILPAHLAHHDGLFFRFLGTAFYILKPVVWLFQRINQLSAVALDRFVERVYMPVLNYSLRAPLVVVCVALSTLIVSAGFIKSGMIPFVVFPKLDRNDIQATITFQDGTPKAVTDAATERLERAIEDVTSKHTTHDGRPIVKTVYRTVGSSQNSSPMGPQGNASGSHIGNVVIELVDTSERSVKSNQLLSEWREAAGEFAGAENAIFESPRNGPGGIPIEFKLLADAEHIDELEAAVEECKQRLAGYPGVFDIADDSTPGKYEFQIRIKDKALAMGIPLADLAETVRASYYGDEVMRLQRGRHEVKLMVRYPDAERRSLANFDDIRVRADDGAEYPITELADIKVSRGYSQINRVDQLRSITITADLNNTVPGANARETVSDMQKSFMPELSQRFPNVSVRWEGQQETTLESVRSMIIGLIIALVAMYILLVLQFTSYAQPILIMLIIPFGAIGAIFGHFLLGLSVTMFSLFGLVALTGVVVNDSIVLIDFINTRTRKQGMPSAEAVIDAGRRRFRPVLLTSVTTVAGLTPILLETSLQAQFLIPMATSLCFGIMISTLLVLVLVPTFYTLLDRLVHLMSDHVEQPKVDDASATEVDPVLA